jgi:hypothetical protein
MLRIGHMDMPLQSILRTPFHADSKPQAPKTVNQN